MGGLFDDEPDDIDLDEEPDPVEDDDIIDVGGPSETQVEPSEPTPTRDNSLVQPVDDLEKVIEVYETFDRIKSELLDREQDIVEISGNNHIKKSGWRKIATAFNLDVEILTLNKEISNGVFEVEAIAQATAPNGKFTTSSSHCASNESNHMQKLEGVVDMGDPDHGWDKGDDDVVYVDGAWRRIKPIKAINKHNIITTAETRAKNRAISDLVGGGEVSAEEIGKNDVFG